MARPGRGVLHVLVLDKLLPRGAGRAADVPVRASAARGERRRWRRRQCQLAVLVPPATMDHVEQIAGNLEKMPPKSTYFYPKLLSGLVFNSLKGN